MCDFDKIRIIGLLKPSHSIPILLYEKLVLVNSCLVERENGNAANPFAVTWRLATKSRPFSALYACANYRITRKFGDGLNLANFAAIRQI